MVDSIEQLDIVDAALPPARWENFRVSIELNASWTSRMLGYPASSAHRSSLSIRPWRARAIIPRPGFTLVRLKAMNPRSPA